MTIYKLKDFLKYLDDLETHIRAAEESEKLEEFLDLPIYYDEEKGRYFLKELSSKYVINYTTEEEDSNYWTDFRFEIYPAIVLNNWLLLDIYSFIRNCQSDDDSSSWDYDFSEDEEVYIYLINLNDFKEVVKIQDSVNYISITPCYLYSDQEYIYYAFNFEKHKFKLIKINPKNVENGFSLIEKAEKKIFDEEISSADFIKEVVNNKKKFTDINYYALEEIVISLIKEKELEEKYLKEVIDYKTFCYFLNNSNIFSAYHKNDEAVNYLIKFLKTNFSRFFSKNKFEYKKENVKRLLKFFKSEIIYWFSDDIKKIDEKLYNKCLEIAKRKVYDFRKIKNKCNRKKII